MDEKNVLNYCASFIDLLGQRDALKGQNILPDVRNEDIKKEWMEKRKTLIDEKIDVTQFMIDLIEKYE